MISFKFSLNNIGAKRPCRIKTSASIKDTYFVNPLVCLLFRTSTLQLGEVTNTPTSSAMKRASPIPIGAIKVARCF